MAGLSSIATYDPSYAAQGQTINVGITSKTYNSDGTCSAVPYGKLGVSGGTAQWQGGENGAYDSGITDSSNTVTWSTSSQYFASAQSISARFAVSSWCGGLFSDGTYHRKCTVSLTYSGTASGTVDLAVVNLAGTSAEIEIPVQFSLSSGNYTFQFTIKTESTAALKGGGSWYLDERYRFIGGTVEISGNNNLYSGEVQLLGVGR